MGVIYAELFVVVSVVHRICLTTPQPRTMLHLHIDCGCLRPLSADPYFRVSLHIMYHFLFLRNISNSKHFVS